MDEKQRRVAGAPWACDWVAYSAVVTAETGVALRCWLLDGDTAIRWQTRRDLLDEPEDVYSADRAAVSTTGWSPGVSGVDLVRANAGVAGL